MGVERMTTGFRRDHRGIVEVECFLWQNKDVQPFAAPGCPQY